MQKEDQSPMDTAAESLLKTQIMQIANKESPVRQLMCKYTYRNHMKKKTNCKIFSFVYYRETFSNLFPFDFTFEKWGIVSFAGCLIEFQL